MAVARSRHRLAMSAAVVLFVAAGAWAVAPEFEVPRRLSGGAFRVTSQAAPAVVDFNGDGLPDLVIAGAGQAGIYFNRGVTTAPRFDALDVPLPLSSGGSVQAVDFNRDGLPDVLLCDRVFLNTGTRESPSFDAEPQKGAHIVWLKSGPLPAGYTPMNRATLVDLSGDGRFDLVMAVFKTQPVYEAYSGRYVVAFDEGQGAQGQFGPPQWLSIRAVRNGKEVEYTDHGPCIAFTDAERMGHPEAVVGSYGGVVFRLIPKEGLTWSLPNEPLVSRGAVGIYAAPTVADLNGDGLPDLVVGDFSGAVWVAWNRGARNVSAFTPFETLHGGEFRVGEQFAFDVADYDGDGRNDILVGERIAAHAVGAVRLFRNIGSPPDPRFQFDAAVFAEGAALGGEGVWCHAVPQFADLDCDGAGDLLLAAVAPGAARARCTVYFNRGGPHPSFYRSGPLTTDPYCLADLRGSFIELAPGFNARWGDLDGDGLADLVAGGTEVVFYRNTGRATRPILAPGTSLATAGGAKLSGVVAVGDLTGDGLPDLVLGSRERGPLRFCQNLGPAAAPRFAEPVILSAGGKPLAFAEGVFPVLCDLDGDGASDLIIGMQRSCELHWLKLKRER